MAIGRITYEDKIDYQKQGQDDRYKVTAKDMNEIKKIINKARQKVILHKQIQSISIAGIFQIAILF